MPGIYSFQHLDLQDISELFVARSDFIVNNFTGCKEGGGAISIAVGVFKDFSMVIVCGSAHNAL